ncbi:MAG: DEAD/DEAH box helicase [Nitrosopumilus sp.]
MGITYRKSTTQEMFFLTFPKSNLFLRSDVKTIEGWRWRPEITSWTVPSSLRTIKELDSLGFTPKGAETTDYISMIRELETGAHRLGDALCYELDVAGKTLWPYQLAGYKFFKKRKTGLLYDAVGVGKTLQGIAWAKDEDNILVICPKIVISQWRDLLDTEGRKDAVVINYEQLHKLENVTHNTALIVDEAHLIKNTKTERHKRVIKVSKKVRKVLALTGTPLVNRPIDLWAIYLLCGMREPNQFWSWAMAYTGAYKAEFGWNFSGATNLDLLKEDMLHWSLRRELEEVWEDMPETTTLRLEIESEEKEERVDYDSRILGLLNGGISLHSAEGIGEIQSLRQATARAKVPFLREWIKNHLDSGGRGVAVFASFKQPLYDLCSPFEGQYITGDIGEQEREKAKSDFGNGFCKVIGLTYGAGGVGLDNLQYGADTVILLDLPWTPTEYEQAIARVRRRGMQGPLQVIIPVVDSVIEKFIADGLDRKQSAFTYLKEVL